MLDLLIAYYYLLCVDFRSHGLHPLQRLVQHCPCLQVSHIRSSVVIQQFGLAKVVFMTPENAGKTVVRLTVALPTSQPATCWGTALTNLIAVRRSAYTNRSVSATSALVAASHDACHVIAIILDPAPGV